MRTQVLIVGGGLVGLTASLLTGQYGIRSVLVEKHATTSPQPKARRFNTRTMEVYRSLGVAGDVEKAGADLANYQSMRAGPTLVIGRPGTRVPHAWVRPGQTSTLDLCGAGVRPAGRPCRLAGGGRPPRHRRAPGGRRGLAGSGRRPAGPAGRRGRVAGRRAGR
jgi:hypothetical protein